MSDPVNGLRVLVRLNSLELGGTQLNAVDFAAQLQKHGVSSYLVGPRWSIPSGPSVLDVAAAKGLQIQVYDPGSTTIAEARQLTRLADQAKADLVHVYGTSAGARPTYWGPAFCARRPWIQTIYDMAVPPGIHAHMPLVVGTGYLRDDLESRPGQTVMISPPVDLAADRPGLVEGPQFRRDQGVPNGVLIVIVSRLTDTMKAHSVEIAIKGMREFFGESVSLLIVGTGNAEQRLRTLADQVNSEAGRPIVRLVGALADPRPAYASADIVLGMGGSAARALAFGKALVVQGEAGWSNTFEPATSQALARASYWSPDRVPDPVRRLVQNLIPLVRDSDRRFELGRFGRAFAVKRFGLQGMTMQLADLYGHAMQNYRLKDWILDLRLERTYLAQRIARTFGGRG